MSHPPLTQLFDKTVLPSSLESEDPDLLLSFYEMYVGQIQNASDILRLASQPYDFEPLKRIAHSLKSSSRSVGAVAVADVLQQLEQAASNRLLAQTESMIGIVLEQMRLTTEKIAIEIDSLRSAGARP